MLYICTRRYCRLGFFCVNQIVKYNYEDSGYVCIEDGIRIPKEEFAKHFEIYVDNCDH